METIAQEAKRLLDPIPEGQWVVRMYTDGKSRCCAFGHFNRLQNNPSDFGLINCAYSERERLLENISLRFLKGSGTIASVNNREFEIYKQPTPKKRVMALLDDMIKAGY